MNDDAAYSSSLNAKFDDLEREFAKELSEIDAIQPIQDDVDEVAYNPPLMPQATTSKLPRDLLYNGARYVGHQKSKGCCYDFEAVIEHIDEAKDELSGTLCIHGLTADFPTMTTFFTAEIIGKRHHFLTRKWDAREEVDKAHWGKFIPFVKTYLHRFNDDEFSHDHIENDDFVYMRWKEQFLIDQNVKTMEGASIAGFYYILLDKRYATINGYYYQKNTELFQSISLRHVPDRTTRAFQIR